MKISKDTFAILTNCMQYNPNFAFQKGNEIKTVSSEKSAAIWAKVPEEFEDFSVYDMARFIDAVKVFDDPDIEFNSDCIRISEGQRQRDYPAASASVVPPAKEPKVKHESIIEFDITPQELHYVQKFCSQIGVEEVTFKGEKGGIFVSVEDTKNPNIDSYSSKVGETDLEFKAIIKVKYLKVIQDNYTVNIYPNMILLTSKDRELKYYIILDANSVIPS